MKKNSIYNVFRFYFGVGILLAVIYFIVMYIIAHRIVSAEIKEMEKSMKEYKPRADVLIERLDNKQFINMLTKQKHIFHKDTLYFLSFPKFRSRKAIAETKKIEALALSQAHKPFRLMYVVHQKEEKALRDWATQQKLDLKKCFLTPDLKFESLKYILYDNKERYYSVNPIHWNHSYIKDFFNQLYSQK